MDLPFNVDLSGQVAVVTGGSGVIGGMFAKALGACGAKVCVLGRKAENGAPVVDEIKKAGGEATAFAANVTDKESLLEAKKQILDTYGKINILLNVAGGAIKSAMVLQDQLADQLPGEDTLFTMDPDNIKKEIDLNLYGTVLPTIIFGEAMLGQENANIVNIASMSSYRPLTRILGYSAAKAAVMNFTEWAAVYLAKSNVRVNAIAPGFFQTTQNRALQFNEDGTPTHRTEKILRSTPQGKFGDPEDLVGGLLYLVSPASRFVTGVTLPIDGGFSSYTGV